MNNSVEFATQIRNLLEEWIIARYGKRGKGLFAETVGLHQSQLSQYLSKKSPTVPGGEVLARFTRAGLNPAWLLTGEGPMDVPRSGDFLIDTGSPVGTYPGEKRLSDVIDLNDPQALDHIEWTESVLQTMKEMIARQKKKEKENE